MKPSDFPKGMDGKRFEAGIDSVRCHDSLRGYAVCHDCFEEDAKMIADALERVAKWEDEQKRKDGDQC